MKKSWRLLDKILSRQKLIESRWYKLRHCPWDKIHTSDTIWFKNSGEPVTVKATVQKVLQFDNLTPSKVAAILDRYGSADGIAVEDREKFFRLFRFKKFCLLIFLKDAKKVRPFNISKKGFGSMSAWLTVSDINRLRV